MTLDELFEGLEIADLFESARPIWGRSGKKIVRKFRCTQGRKQGRIVSDPTTCGKGVDVKKRQVLRKTMMAKGTRLRRKALRTKKKNPISIRLQKMNKQAGK